MQFRREFSFVGKAKAGSQMAEVTKCWCWLLEGGREGHRRSLKWTGKEETGYDDEGWGDVILKLIGLVVG